MNTLKVIPFFTGKKTLEEVLKDRRAAGLLWLEILFNDGFAWERHMDTSEIKDAYEKASIWYSSFKSVIEDHIKRKPLRPKKGKADQREYRRFIEALSFVSGYR